MEWEDVLPPVEDYFLVSEASLKAAVHALQNIATQGRCHYSRNMARTTLKAIGTTGDVETGPDGMPERVPGHDLANLMAVQNHYQSDGK